MVTHELLEDERILVVFPSGALSGSDFETLARAVDPFIEARGSLRGLLIDAPSFPGWENLAGLLAHFRFVHDHHRKIAKVAAVSDAGVLAIAPKLMNHFVSAELRHFAHEERAKAMAWLMQE